MGAGGWQLSASGVGVVVTFQAKPRKPVDPNKVEALAEYEIRMASTFEAQRGVCGGGTV